MDHQPAPGVVAPPYQMSPPPYQMSPPPYPMSPPPQRPLWNGKTNGFAIAALTMSMFGCAILLSTAFGILAVVQTRRNGDRRGRRFAIAALVINGIWVLVIAGAVVAGVVTNIAQGPDRDATGAIRGERSIAVADLRVGDCIKDIKNEYGTYVDVAPCSVEHTSEVFAQFTLPDGPWPGDAKAQQAAHDGCESRFQGYTGAAPRGSDRLLAESPDALDWPKDRGVLCMTYQPAGTTGSVRR
ncbi:septum formation family protein [Jidongwangia harbinensis]|uniref:septum formation family protein n=1 Tax=Jidongwangia harbinensis TaxID=2878561 RepID=UPI001CD92BAA|nr:septum formation family protein [Jidongwangia harbinensis]MCA2213013.1 septum formation family protein [Jidongwangia harbinensis]